MPTAKPDLSGLLKDIGDRKLFEQLILKEPYIPTGNRCYHIHCHWHTSDKLSVSNIFCHQVRV